MKKYEQLNSNFFGIRIISKIFQIAHLHLVIILFSKPEGCGWCIVRVRMVLPYPEILSGFLEKRTIKIISNFKFATFTSKVWKSINKHFIFFM